MKTWVKVLLGCGALVVLAAFALSAGASWWWHHNAGRLTTMGKQAASEAKDFAATHDQQACVEETFHRADRCGPGVGFECRVIAKVFDRACLRQAAPTTDFCKGVPKTTALLSTATWRSAECVRMGRGNDSNCEDLLAERQQWCEGQP